MKSAFVYSWLVVLVCLILLLINTDIAEAKKKRHSPHKKRPRTPTKFPTKRRPTKLPTRKHTPAPTRFGCPIAFPVRCSPRSGRDYCCQRTASGGTNVCCLDQSTCACPGTGRCPVQHFCCPALAPVSCQAINTGDIYCCSQGPNGTDAVCCQETASCAFPGTTTCCPFAKPLFCLAGVDSLFCCPPLPNGSNQVCCLDSRTCSRDGTCPASPGVRSANSHTKQTPMMAIVDALLGRMEAVPATSAVSIGNHGSKRHIDWSTFAAGASLGRAGHFLNSNEGTKDSGG